MHHCRWRVLPAAGKLLVSTDLHGNGDDFRTLREIFLAEARTGSPAHWALLGDLVHAPNPRSALEDPIYYDYPDESWTIVSETRELRRQWPDHVHVLLGNHDHAHVGGPRVSKFYGDEAGHLESTLAPEQVAEMRAFFESTLLAAVAPCGLLLAHGSPSDDLTSLTELDELSLDTHENSASQNRLLRRLLTSYGQPRETTARLLAAVGSATGLDLHVVVHGHDRDPEGWFAEAGNQLCPVIFGARRETKRYLEIDLAAHYGGASDLRDGVEIRRLYG